MPAHLATPRPRGLTLVEVACVLAVLSVLAALTLPAMQQFADGQRLRVAAAELAADLRYLRSEGLARNQALRWRLQATPEGDCYLVHTGAAGACKCSVGSPPSCSGEARALRSVHWPATLRVRLEANVATLRFDPRHGTVTPTGTLRVVGSQGAAIHHVINIVGRVRSCTAGAGVAGYPPC